MMLRKKILILITLITVKGFAQKINLEEYKKKYTGYNAVLLKQSTEATIRLGKKEKIAIESKEQEEVLILNQSGTVYGHKYLYSDSFTKSEIEEAHTLVPDGDGYKKIKATDIVTKSDVGQSSFFDDRKSTHITFPALTPGAITHIESGYSYTEPRFFGSEFFGSYIPSEEVSYTIKCPKSIQLKYELFNTEKCNVEFTKTEKGKNIIYNWTVKNAKEYKQEDNAPNLRYFAPHIVVYIASYQKKDSIKNLLAGPADLYSWYYDLTKDVNQKKDEKLQRIVDSLVKNCSTEKEKVKKIYYWVQDNIKYIAFEDGLGGFVPREAASVCEKRFGDCKDMASIINNMLHLADIPSYLTWIGSRDIPYTYKQVPTPSTDNHMITTYIDEKGNHYYLDATGKDAQLGMHTSMIQGKQALLGKGKDNFEIATVPEIPKETNVLYDSIYLNLDGNKLKGKGELTLNGYHKINFDYRMKQYTYKDKINFMKGYLSIGNNKCKVDTVIISNQNEKELATKAQFQFSVDDYLVENNDEKYLNLNLDKSEIQSVINIEKRESPVEYTFKKIENTYVQFNVPSGYTCSYIPPNASYSNSKFGFTIQYKLNKDVLVQEKKFYIDTLMLNPADFKEWNDMMKELNKAYHETVVLKKSGTK